MDAPAPSTPAVLETHVSVLVFLEDLVLKLKKPLRMPFLDFSTVQARRLACEAEVAVNRRLSPDVYLGVAELRLGEDVLDHAVVMRRLPAKRSLAALAARHAPEADEGVRRLAGFLAAFHAGAPRSEEIAESGRAASLEQTWERSLAVLEPFAGRQFEAGLLADVASLAFAYLRGRARLLERRVAGGFVCDGHGDLLAGDVFLLDDGPRVLDAIEFDDKLRHVDVAADLAFLLMDLEHHRAPDLAELLLSRYEEASGEAIPATLLHHYIAHRAVVRAEVSCLRTDQQAGDQAPRRAGDRGASAAPGLLELARRHLRAGRVLLVVVSGPPGTGKSSLAAALGSRLSWPVLRSDEIRREIADPGGTGPVVAEDAYRPAVTANVYETMLRRAEVALGLGQPVVLDATFAEPVWRRRVEGLARSTSSELVAVACTAPAAVAARRVAARRERGSDVSGAGAALSRWMAERWVAWESAAEVDTAAHGTGAIVEDLVRREGLAPAIDTLGPTGRRPGGAGVGTGLTA